MKKLFALLLAAVLCFSLVACGNKDKATIDTIKTEIAPIMSEYGVDEYDITLTASERYEIICPSAKTIADKKICNILKELIALGDIEADGKDVPFSGNIRIEEDGDYYYYVNAAQAELSNRSSAGLYRSDAPSRCLYEDED